MRLRPRAVGSGSANAAAVETHEPHDGRDLPCVAANRRSPLIPAPLAECRYGPKAQPKSGSGNSHKRTLGTHRAMLSSRRRPGHQQCRTPRHAIQSGHPAVSEIELNDNEERNTPPDQLAFALAETPAPP